MGISDSRRNSPSLPAAQAPFTNHNGANSPRHFRNAEGGMHMKLNYKTSIGMIVLAGTLFACEPAAFSQVSIGIQIGAPPPPRVVAVRPPCPDPEDTEYMWIDGYWYPAEGHYYWHRGYWSSRDDVG